jgi:signal peptidase I
LVQQELHPSDEGREGHGDPGQPGTDQAAAGVPEALTPERDDDAGAAPLQAGVDSVAEAELPPLAGLPPLPDLPPLAELPPLVPAPVAGFEAMPPVPAAEADAAAAASSSYVEISDAGAAPMVMAGGAVALLNVWKDEFIAWFKTLASAAVYATLIVTFGFQVARVEGQSMAPTLEDQDRLIVNKLAYRMGEPRRGDIVMLYYPVNPDKSFVKRVIAEEGDEVRIVDGRVFVKMPSGYEVQLPDDFVPPEYRSHEDFGPELVKDGYYFVMGDHRNNSSDSRHWGQVPKKYIIGKVQLRWWPIPNARVF